MDQSTPFFILSRHWQDTDDGIALRFWLCNNSDRQCWTLSGQESVCFVAEKQLAQWQVLWRRTLPSPRVGTKTFLTLMGDVVVAVYTKSFRTQRYWVRQGKDIGLKVWEDDINPADRYLMERFLFGGITQTDAGKITPVHFEPEFRKLSIDIETDWFVPGEVPDLFSIALAGLGLEKVFVVSPEKEFTSNGELSSNIVIAESVKQCLELAIAAITEFDPDCIIGWNVIDFDLRILQKHCDKHNVKFAIGREHTEPYWRARADGEDRFYIDVEGRQIIDGPGAFRSAAWSFDDYSLETVSQTLLRRGKKIEHADDRVGEIERMYREDLDAFARYNLEDAQLVLDLFDIAGLWHFLIERSHLTGLAIDRVGGSSAAFNTVYLPRLHRKGFVATSIGEQTLQVSSPGGFVMDSLPGIYENVLVLDFKSLYPSIIRTFLIDPLGLYQGLKADPSEAVPGFLEAKFHREEHILPALIDQLWQARDQAKAEKNAPMSQAIKIIMNSFYGVLGSNLCRFFDPRLASSVTMRGHEILQHSKRFIEEQGYQVIYGDTDSVFVHAGSHADPVQLGDQLAVELNKWWQNYVTENFQLECRLEIEFETHYEQFVMPTIRGTEKGSKKRYAGRQIEKGKHKLVFKGLEAVRSDWTVMAKEFQKELYRLVFEKKDYRPYIVETVQRLQRGDLDELLIYRRRLRRNIEHYEKQLPPHVQAAWLKRQHLPQWRGRQVEYVKTVQGWQPIPFVTSAIDYDHYLEKQIAPIADALIHFLGDDFNSIIDDQMSLF